MCVFEMLVLNRMWLEAESVCERWCNVTVPVCEKWSNVTVPVCEKWSNVMVPVCEKWSNVTVLVCEKLRYGSSITYPQGDIWAAKYHHLTYLVLLNSECMNWSFCSALRSWSSYLCNLTYWERNLTYGSITWPTGSLTWPTGSVIYQAPT